jgi:hypothetical protein
VMSGDEEPAGFFEDFVELGAMARRRTAPPGEERRIASMGDAADTRGCVRATTGPDAGGGETVAIVMRPIALHNGFISGAFPPRRIGDGEHLQTTLGSEPSCTAFLQVVAPTCRSM